MGRIKTKMMKRLTFKMLNKHREELKEDFNENKKVVEQFMSTNNKKVRNTVAGYVTRLMKHKDLL